MDRVTRAIILEPLKGCARQEEEEEAPQPLTLEDTKKTLVDSSYDPSMDGASHKE